MYIYNIINIYIIIFKIIHNIYCIWKKKKQVSNLGLLIYQALATASKRPPPGSPGCSSGCHGDTPKNDLFFWRKMMGFTFFLPGKMEHFRAFCVLPFYV